MHRLVLPLVASLGLAACASAPERLARDDAPATEAAVLSRIAVASARRRPDFDTVGYGTVADSYLLPLLGDAPKEWYCGCNFDPADKQVDWNSCGFEPVTQDDARRGARIEWEHVVPQSWSATAAGCDSTNTCSGAAFNRMVTDPYALVPAVGALNGKRSNHVMWEVQGESRPYGQCDFEVGQDDDGQLYIEPPDHLKGDLARITLYMASRYGIDIPQRGAKALYKRWHKQDPVDHNERERVRAIRQHVADWKFPYDR
jgi:deoxyribonuclease-1